MRILYFQDDNELLRKVCLSQPLGSLFIDWFNKKTAYATSLVSYVAFPEEWIQHNALLKNTYTLSHEHGLLNATIMPQEDSGEWIYFLNAYALISFDESHLNKTLCSLPWDVAFIQVYPELQAANETVKMTPDSQVVGFRRLYKDSIEPMEQPLNWPDLVIFKKNVWSQFIDDGEIALDYQFLLSKLRALKLNVTALSVGGNQAIFNNENIFLNCLDDFQSNGKETSESLHRADIRVAGPILIGEGVTIEPDVTLIGPVVLSDGVSVKTGAVIRRSIIGENLIVDQKRIVNNQICLDTIEKQQEDQKIGLCFNPLNILAQSREYRKWPFISYERLGKRVFDICAASIVLILLIPIFPVIMLVIKLTSKGPIFYKARRQGLHGRDFNCLKFRTMIHKADSIQERLRVVNQVDGPQFKIDNDPRISGVGKFLRDTCIDELPQFINVFFGQMSIVGPRPSPENENDSCPVWRDARLSVRPGITGLWQICRTRRSSSDFQEWVYYDTEYVRNLSFRKDLWICWKTAHKLIKEFLGQFG